MWGQREPKESQKGANGNQKGANGSQKGNQNGAKREARGAQMGAPRFVWKIENIESGKMDNREKQNDQEGKNSNISLYLLQNMKCWWKIIKVVKGQTKENTENNWKKETPSMAIETIKTYFSLKIQTK